MCVFEVYVQTCSASCVFIHRSHRFALDMIFRCAFGNDSTCCDGAASFEDSLSDSPYVLIFFVCSYLQQKWESTSSQQTKNKKAPLQGEKEACQDGRPAGHSLRGPAGGGSGRGATGHAGHTGDVDPKGPCAPTVLCSGAVK